MLGASRRLVAASAAVPRRFLSGAVPAWARPATFVEQHIGPSPAQREQMLKSMGYSSMQKFVEATVPSSLLSTHQLQIGEPLSEQEALAEFQSKITLNKSGIKSLIGQGYYGVVTPAVLQSRLLEDASWYTPYTPYQAEIAQGRLEMLLNYQTMIVELTGMQVRLADVAVFCIAALLRLQKFLRFPMRLCLTRARLQPRPWLCAALWSVPNPAAARSSSPTLAIPRLFP